MNQPRHPAMPGIAIALNAAIIAAEKSQWIACGCAPGVSRKSARAARRDAREKKAALLELISAELIAKATGDAA